MASPTGRSWLRRRWGAAVLRGPVRRCAVHEGVYVQVRPGRGRASPGHQLVCRQLAPLSHVHGIERVGGGARVGGTEGRSLLSSAATPCIIACGYLCFLSFNFTCHKLKFVVRLYVVRRVGRRAVCTARQELAASSHWTLSLFPSTPSSITE